MTRRKTFEERLEEWNIMYDNFYEYIEPSSTATTKFKIKCPLHGVFETTPNYHQQGSGCPSCGILTRSKKRSISFEDYIKKAQEKHNNKYKYLSTGTHSKSKIDIECPSHGIFTQAIGVHANGRGCPKCAHEILTNTKKKEYSDYIIAFNLKHNNFYTYPLFTHVGKNKIEIICPIHGSFFQTINNHQKGQRCPNCALDDKENTGWSYTQWEKAGKLSLYFESYKLYFINFFNDSESFIKIGRTFRSIENRFKSSKYNYKVLKIIEYDDAKSCCLMEKQLHKKYKKYSYKPLFNFQGQTECFSNDIKDEIGC